MKVRRILHPTDFSSASRKAFARALAMAKADRAELVVVHVLSSAVPAMPDGYISPAVYEDMMSAMRSQAQKQLDRLVARAKAGGVRARAVLVQGTPADGIVRAARSQRADVIVIGTHGRTGLARVFLGSVAERVIGTASCPVLTVRGS